MKLARIVFEALFLLFLPWGSQASLRLPYEAARMFEDDWSADFAAGDAAQPEANPPLWPTGEHHPEGGMVKVFGPEDQLTMNITEVIANLTKDLNNVTTGHFSTRRVALMFRPGEYNNVTVEVGYYTQVLGLGTKASDVFFNKTAKGIYVPSDIRKPDPGSLDAFWRSAENFMQKPSDGCVVGHTRPEDPDDPWPEIVADNCMMWSVSQAAPIRRVHVLGNLSTCEDGAWASGGFLANVLVKGSTHMGGQQQWMSRNSDLGSPDRNVMGGNWNMVFVGCTGAPASRYPQGAAGDVGIVNEAATPVIAEKPYITIDTDGKYSLQIPPVKWMAVGSDIDLSPNETGTLSVPFEQVFVAIAGNPNQTDAGVVIQTKLDAGLHVVLAPGIYYLARTLVLKSPGQVLLGIGMATLQAPIDGTPCVRVLANVPNVRVAGLMLGASHVDAPAGVVTTLLEWGEEGVKDHGSRDAPGIMSDIFARVGGPDKDREVSVDKMVRVYSGNVVGDNLWLWRADHALLDPGENQTDIDDPKKKDYHLVEKGEYPCEAGLEVMGDHVTMYGLFVEHTLGNMTQWRGEDGKVFFYQSELPYDVNQTWLGALKPGDVPYAGYTVADGVTSHQAHGIGVYSYFRDHVVWVNTSIRAPDTDGVRFNNAFSRYLNGHGGLNAVLNNKGLPANGTGSRMGRIASSLGDEAEIPDVCPIPDVPDVPADHHVVYIVIIVILVILLLLTALYAYFLRASVLKRSFAAGDPSPRDVDNQRNQGGISLGADVSIRSGGD